jgi:hypothetical protein
MKKSGSDKSYFWIALNNTSVFCVGIHGVRYCHMCGFAKKERERPRTIQYFNKLVVAVSNDKDEEGGGGGLSSHSNASPIGMNGRRLLLLISLEILCVVYRTLT